MDTAHQVIQGAGISISGSERRTETDADGRFVVDSLEPGVYQLSVRRFGYEVLVQEYQVAGRGSAVRICLVPRVTRLIPVVTSASRLGLTGIVGDSVYHLLPGAEVRVMAERDRATTDSAGAFHLALKPGTYALVVSKSGFGRQLLSVTIPQDSGRDVSIWLGSEPRNPNRLAAAYDDMRIRLETANPVRSALWSAERIGQTSVDLRFVIGAAIGDRVPFVCNALIDGGPYLLSVDVINKDDVAMLEVYLAKAPRAATRSISAGGSAGGKILSTVPSRPATCGQLDVYVWMK